MSPGSEAGKQAALSDALEVQKASSLDIADLLTLINLIQPHIPWSEEHLRWQFFDAPSGPAELYLVRDKSTQAIVSLYAAIRQHIRVGQKLFPGKMVQDVMTHPDYRGKGLLHFLGSRCAEEIIAQSEVGYTFPNESSEKSFRRNSWIELCRVPTWQSETASVGSLKADSQLFQKLPHAFPAEATQLWLESGLKIGVERSAAFLNWRYSKPKVAYEKCIIGDMQGVLVLKFYEKESQKTMHICDLFVRKSAEHLIGGVLKHALAYAKSQGAGKVTAWLPKDHPYAPLYAEHGLKFLESDSRFMFVLSGENLKAEISNPRDWHVSQGDSDVY